MQWPKEQEQSLLDYKWSLEWNISMYLALALPEHNDAQHTAAENAGSQHNGHKKTQTRIDIERILVLKAKTNAIQITIAAATRTGDTRIVIVALGHLDYIAGKSL